MKQNIKITLVNPPSPFLIDDRVFVPLGILYIAAVLREKGYKIEFVDLSKRKDWREILAGIHSDMICTTGTTPHYPYLKEIVNITRNNTKKLIVGGPHATIDPQSLLDIGYDTIIAGEGETAIEQALYTDKNIIYSKRVENLDSLPFPARDLVDIKSYKYMMENEPLLHLVCTRGCPFKCGFCCNLNRKVIFRTVSNCIEEMKDITSKFGIRRFMFFDDTFTLNKKWLIEFCEKITKLNVKWRCFVRADTVNKEILAMMKESGCSEIGVGVESGSQKILDIMNKGTTIEDNTRCRKLCEELNVLFKAFIIIGLPGENMDTFQETRKWLLENRPDKYSIFVFTPYPGSPFFENKEKYDFELTGEYDYGKLWWGGIMTDQISVSRTSALTAEQICELRNNLLIELKEKGLDDINNII